MNFPLLVILGGSPHRKKKEEKEKQEEEKEKEEEGQEAPYNWLTPDHPPLTAFTGNL